jgi:hypothetical protein
MYVIIYYRGSVHDVLDETVINVFTAGSYVNEDKQQQLPITNRFTVS